MSWPSDKFAAKLGEHHLTVIMGEHGSKHRRCGFGNETKPWPWPWLASSSSSFSECDCRPACLLSGMHGPTPTWPKRFVQPVARDARTK